MLKSWKVEMLKGWKTEMLKVWEVEAFRKLTSLQLSRLLTKTLDLKCLVHSTMSTFQVELFKVEMLKSNRIARLNLCVCKHFSNLNNVHLEVFIIWICLTLYLLRCCTWKLDILNSCKVDVLNFQLQFSTFQHFQPFQLSTVQHVQHFNFQHVNISTFQHFQGWRQTLHL